MGMTLDWRRTLLQLVGTAVIGVSAGLAAVAFHAGMDFLFQRLVAIPSRLPFPLFLLFVLIAMGVAAFVTGRLMTRYAPDAPGSGIPQVKAAYHSGHLDFSWNLIWVKFLGGVISIGSGASLGREGPTIHIGAAIASKVGKLFGEDQETRANAVCAGSAAGLAAAFSSPLAGVTLVLEEIAGGQNQNKFAGRSLLAAALASSIVYMMNHGAAALPVGEDIPLRFDALYLSPVVAIVAGGAGLFFQWGTLALRARCKSSRLSVPVRLTLGALVGGVIAAVAFGATGHLGAFGLGEGDLQSALQNRIVWSVALWLLAAKLLSTMFCYGTGGCGGIFAPIIFFGGMAGVFVHGLAAPYFDLTSQDQTALALVGMTACLGAVVRAPITSILIVMEMTWQIHVLPALMIAAVIAVSMNRLCFRGNFYDEALRQDGIHLED